MTTLLPRGTETGTGAAVRARPAPRAASGRASAAPALAPPAAPAVVRAGRPRLPFAALVLLLLGGGLCALLALNTASAAGEVRERELADRVRTLSDTEQDLRRQVAALEAPSALAAAAAGLGMVPGQHPAFLVIGPDGTVSVLGDPQAAPLPVPLPDPNAAPAPDPNAAPAPTGTPDAAPAPVPTTAPAATADAAATPAPDPAAAPTPDPAVTAAPAPAATPDAATPPAAAQ